MIYAGLPVGAIIAIAIVVLVLVIIIGFVAWYIKTGNRLLGMQEDCDNAVSQIDVYLTKRFDTLTKMLDITKGYAKHEKETLIGVVEMRRPVAGSTIAEKQACEAQMNQAMKNINIVMERYPELKADKSFGQLNNAVLEIEEELQAARRTYNSNVKALNKTIVVFPSSFVANKKGITKRDYFEAEEQKRQDVKMDFS
jgi:LemA protein